MPGGCRSSGGRACFSASVSHLGRHRGEGHDLLLPDRSTPRVAELPSASALTVCKTAVSTDRAHDILHDEAAKGDLDRELLEIFATRRIFDLTAVR